VKINSIRLGFANNSSSTHSILLGSSHREVFPDNGGYGWDWFHLRSNTAKRHYFAAQLYGALPRNINDDFKKMIIENLTGIDFRIDADAVPSVDHQSCWAFPKNYDEEAFDSDFIMAFLEFLDKSHVTIRGGNDNSDEEELVAFGEKAKFEKIPIHEYSGNFICRKDKDYFTLFNRENGTKIRLTFNLDENGNPLSEYKFSTSPELVDIKITDYCDFGCQFCVLGDTKISTPSGKKCISNIKIGDIVYGYDIENKKRTELKVEQTFEREYNGDLIKIEFENGKSIKMTLEHEVFTSNRGWIKAEKIEEGDKILTENKVKSSIRIKSIERIQYNGKVFNIETSPCHNYFANKILVHNCYMGSTKRGKHADEEFLRSIVYSLSSLKVLEVALGGGETTQHPYFGEYLEELRSHNIIPNFTTFNMDWAKNKEIKKHVFENAGSFAVSSIDGETIKELCKWNKKSQETKGPKGSVHIPLGCYPSEDVIVFLEKRKKNNWESILDIIFLGYKETGRGKVFKKHDFEPVIDWLKAEAKKNTWIRFGADTLFVKQFKDDLEKMGVHESMIVGNEGQFSCYIDAVNKKFASCSYTDDLKDLPDYDIDETILRHFPFKEAV